MQKSQEKAAVLFSIRTKFQAPNPEHKHSRLEAPCSSPLMGEEQGEGETGQNSLALLEQQC
jgi:hypothetical protein